MFVTQSICEILVHWKQRVDLVDDVIEYHGVSLAVCTVEHHVRDGCAAQSHDADRVMLDIREIVE